MIITIAGAWAKPPVFDSPFECEAGPADPTFAEDFAQLARAADTATPAELKAMRRHTSLVEAMAEFDEPGTHRWAREAVRLITSAFGAGASGVFVETSMKALCPSAMEDFDPADTTTLFHLFVTVHGDADAFVAEGMQVFDLPDVVVPLTAETSAGAAQALAFGFAAKMVCDGLRPVEGVRFRLSESAPFFHPIYEAADPEAVEEDPFVNPRGRWVLSARTPG